MGGTLDCTFCIKDHCGEYTNDQDDPKLNMLFVRRNCALEELSPIIRYFPYFLLIIATMLVMMDRPFVKILFKSFNMDEMFKLLVVDDPFSKDFDKTKEVRELKHVMTAGGTNYFLSYLTRTLVSLVVSSVPLIIFGLVWSEFDSDILLCQVHKQYWYECAGHPVMLYKIVMILVMALLGLYFLLNVYNLAWLFLPSLGKLRRIMAAPKRKAANALDGDLNMFYYKNSDVQLLLNLLSSSSGLPGPLRSLALVDKEFNSACLPQLVSCHGTDSDSLQVNIKIKEDSLLHYLATMAGVRISFVMEVDNKTATFQQTAERDYQAGLADTDTSIEEVTIRTMVDGKITASDCFPTNMVAEVNNNDNES